MISDGGFGSAISFAVMAIVGVVLIAAWVILAGSRFIQGGVMERPERVPQLYGYTACLIGLIMAIMAALSLVDSVLELQAPEYGTVGEWGAWEPSVASFEAFRATYDQARQLRAGPGDPPPQPLSEAELRQRYEGLRADRIARTELRARNSIVSSLLSLAIGVGLFVFHWRWLRRRGTDAQGAQAPPVVTAGP